MNIEEGNVKLNSNNNPNRKTDMKKVAIIGAGRLGTALATALIAEGYVITGIWNRSSASVNSDNSDISINSNDFNEDKAKDEAEKGSIKISAGGEPGTMVVDAELIFITVSDSAISGMAERLADYFLQNLSNPSNPSNPSNAANAANAANKVFLHCSGSYDSRVLAPLKDAGFSTGSFHPIQTFSGLPGSHKGLYGIWFGFEGDDIARTAADAVAYIFGSKLLILDGTDRQLYHAAACVISNYFVVLSYIASNLLQKGTSISEKEGLSALYALALKTLNNCTNDGPFAALTGPISRGDLKVVEGHIDAINQHFKEAASPASQIAGDDILRIYKSLGVLALKISKERDAIQGSLKEQGIYDELERILKF